MQIVRTLLRSTAIAAFAGASTIGLLAQESTFAPQSVPHVEPVNQSATLLAANEAPAAVGYSSSAGADETSSALSYIADPGAASANPGGQPPPRRYGRRPVYADSHHNADGSNKYTFFGGAGFTIPTGGSHAYLTPSYDFQVGGGRNFNKKLAMLVQFDWHNFGLQQATVNNLYTIYNSPTVFDGQLSSIGANAHIWSFTVDPMYTFVQGDKVGGYVIGGVGFYHKVTDITTPVVATDYYGYQYQANQIIDSYVSNSVGFNGGLGATYKASRFSDVKFYVEARYVYTANQARPYYDGTTGTSLSANYFDVFPQNSAKTTYIPVTLGVRF